MRYLLPSLLVLLIAGAAGAQRPGRRDGGEPQSPRRQLEGGIARWSGHVSYRIFRADGQPLSELEWPLDILVAYGGGRLSDAGWEARFLFSRSVTEDAGTVENSDWEADDPDLLTTYSESDARLEAWGIEAGARYWLLRSKDGKVRWKLGPGLGYLFRNLEWEARDLDQWYPQNPSWPHDYESGLIGTYKAEVHVPHGELAGGLSWGVLSLSAHAGLAPWMYVHDEDDHKLRYIRAETDATGPGWLGGVAAALTFRNTWLLTARGDVLGFEVDGTEENEVYGGRDEGRRWSADHEIRGLQYSLTAAVGVVF